MRKKDIISQNQDMLADLVKKSEENNSLRRELEEYKKTIDELNIRIEELQNILNSAEEEPEIQVAQETEIVEADEEDNEVFDYGAVIIGKVVLSGAEYAGRITSEDEERANEASENIYLRADEAKLEILSIISSDYSGDRKKLLMEREYQSAVGAFDRILSRL